MDFPVHVYWHSTCGETVANTTDRMILLPPLLPSTPCMVIKYSNLNYTIIQNSLIIHQMCVGKCKKSKLFTTSLRYITVPSALSNLFSESTVCNGNSDKT